MVKRFFSIFFISKPFVFLIPSHSSAHSLLQTYLGVVSQLVAGRGDVAPPVALFHDVVFVVVQGGHLPCDVSPPLAAGGHQAEQPQRSLDAQQPGVAKPIPDNTLRLP